MLQQCTLLCGIKDKMDRMQKRIEERKCRQGKSNIVPTTRLNLLDLDQMDLDQMGLIYLLKPSIDCMTMRHMRVVEMVSKIGSHSLNICGDVFHIEDDTYRVLLNKSILFWDKSAYVQCRIRLAPKSVDTSMLRVSLKIPEQNETNGVCTFFTHCTPSITIFGVSYDLVRREMYMTFHGKALMATEHLHHFDEALGGEYLIYVECVHTTDSYQISFDITRSINGVCLSTHSKQFEYIDTVEYVNSTDSVIEVGKGMCFVGDVQYYVNDLSTDQRAMIKDTCL